MQSEIPTALTSGKGPQVPLFLFHVFHKRLVADCYASTMHKSVLINGLDCRSNPSPWTFAGLRALSSVCCLLLLLGGSVSVFNKLACSRTAPSNHKDHLIRGGDKYLTFLDVSIAVLAAFRSAVLV